MGYISHFRAGTLSLLVCLGWTAPGWAALPPVPALPSTPASAPTRAPALPPPPFPTPASAAQLASPPPTETPPPRCIAIVGTNDLHGAIEPYTFTAPSRYNDPTAPMSGVRTGGVVGLSGYIRALRQSYGKRLVLLDAGDLFQGTLPSNLSQGRAVIDAYNELGYTAAAIGNHEFDFGVGLPAEATATKAEPDPKLAVLKARIAQAKFPFLALNILSKKDGRRIDWPNTAPSILRDMGGIKVGIVGISTVDTPKVTKPLNVASLRFVDPVPLIALEAAKLRQQGAQLVVLVGHVGAGCTDLSRPEDLSSCGAGNSELLEILRALPRGCVDVAIGGHTHKFMAHWVGATATLESGSRGHFLGYVEACVRPKGGIDTVTSHIYGAQPLCLDVWADGTCKKRRKAALPVRSATFLGQSVQPDAALSAHMQPYLDAVRALGARPVGARLPRPLHIVELSQLVAEAMRRAIHSDFGLQNIGGIRSEMAAGPVTYAQVFNVLPFDNATAKVTLRGDQVAALLKVVYHRHGGLGPPGLAGLSYRAGGQVVTAKGTPLEPSRLYTLATSDFLLEGGEGTTAIFDALPSAAKEFAGPAMRDAFVELLGHLFPS
jgi:5'-nucleotidase